MYAVRSLKCNPGLPFSLLGHRRQNRDPTKFVRWGGWLAFSLTAIWHIISLNVGPFILCQFIHLEGHFWYKTSNWHDYRLLWFGLSLTNNHENLKNGIQAFQVLATIILWFTNVPWWSFHLPIFLSKKYQGYGVVAIYADLTRWKQTGTYLYMMTGVLSYDHYCVFP